ncbi:MAG: MBL fold metallo-hydrolase [Firmicutes bacterium]|nr:MBL fold metallo-hydrolase [Bacillota bacterium]
MELIMLGTSAAYPTPERASSGYLVRGRESNILLDMGSGVLRNLLRWMDPFALDAIIITHFHQDHFIDIYPLYYYLAFDNVKRLPIDVYAPAGARDFILQIFPPGTGKSFDNVFSFHTLNDRDVFKVGEFRCESLAVRHNLPTFGQRISLGSRLIAYSSDTTFDEVLFELAAGSDIFICEATKEEDYKDVMHLTAEQAGVIANKAGVGKLILTHIWPDFDPEKQKIKAEKEYSGQVIIAEDNMRLMVGE